MSIIVKFRIVVDRPENRESVLKDLKESYSNQISKSYKSDEPKNFFLHMKFKSRDAINVVKTVNEIYSHSDKIKHVDPMADEKFCLDNIVPMLISAGISFAVVAGLIYGFKIHLYLTDYFYILGIPTVVGFFTEYLHKYT